MQFPAMMSIREFCKLVGISVSTYYAQKAAGTGPRETHIGGRRLVSSDSANEWLKSREEQSTAKAA